jgi:hypothetical protein
MWVKSLYAEEVEISIADSLKKRLCIHRHTDGMTFKQAMIRNMGDPGWQTCGLVTNREASALREAV